MPGTAHPTTAAPAHRLACNRTPALAHLARIRVAGVLADDTQLFPAAAGNAYIQVRVQPQRGLPYFARVLLGTDVADHMLAQADVARMRAGVFVSLAGDALELQHDHGLAVLRVLHARDLVVFSDPISTPSPTAPEEA